MRLFCISKAGLLAISGSVCALWACIGMEKITVARANTEARGAFYRIERLRRPAVNMPVGNPSPPPFSRSPITIG